MSLQKTIKILSIIVIFVIVASVFYEKAFTSERCIDSDATTAKETLIKYFTYLHGGQFSKAISLFEPWEDGEGESRSSWEGLSSFSLPEDRTDKAKVLSNYCKAVGTCLNIEVINIEKVAEGKYKSRVQFIKDNGSVFIYTPCCGATEDMMPLRAVFDYYIHKINGGYKVRTPPLYRP